MMSTHDHRGYVSYRRDEDIHAKIQQELLSLDTTEHLRNDVQSLNENGYIVIKNLLSKEELSAVQKGSTELISRIQDDPLNDDPECRCFIDSERSSSFSLLRFRSGSLI